jgi:tRNA pseudouridine55 synthase
MTQAPIEGVLPLNKPAGMTSHQAVARVRRLLGVRRIGHTGTLDPEVTGVLPLCIGRATRIVEWLQELPKEYEAVMHIGESTDTEDRTGRVTERVESVQLTEQQIRGGMARFVGTIKQVPPMYSAVKHQGKRLHELAREGVVVERKPREAVIHAITVHSIEWRDGHPYVRFTVVCSKGTYVRTLCADIGRSLGYPAVMDSLKRTASGPFRIGRCLSLEDIAARVQRGDIQEVLIPIDRALEHFPAAALRPEWSDRARSGQKLPGESGTWPRTEGPVRLYDADGAFIGIYRMHTGGRVWIPEKLFHHLQD